MTKKELAGIRERLEAAKRCDSWGAHGLRLDWTPERPGRNAAIWYGDGDQCAEVHGNLGLGIDGDAVAEFFAHALEDVDRLLKELEEMESPRLKI